MARRLSPGMTRLQAWLLIVPVVCVSGFGSSLAGGCVILNATTNLQVVKMDSADPVNTGDTITYTVTITNPDIQPGKQTIMATGVVLTDTVSSGTVLSATSSQGTCAVAGNTVTCNIPEVDLDDVVVVTVTVRAPTTPGTVTNTASVISGQPDADLADNTDSESTQVVAANPLSCQSANATDNYITGDAVNETWTCGGGRTPYTVRETTGDYPGGTGAGSCSGGTVGVNGNDVVFGGSFSGAGGCDADMEVADSSSPQQFFAFVQHFQVFDPLQITTPFLNDGVDDAMYTATIATSGGSPGRPGGGVVIGLAPGSSPPPPGLSFVPDPANPNQVLLTGTVTAGGNYLFSVEARDTLLMSQVVTANYTINILEITTTSLPGGTTGALYSEVVNVIGSSGAGVQFSISAGALPDGVTLAANGALAGVPTRAGTFMFTVEATEGPRVESQMFTVVITDPLVASFTHSAAANNPLQVAFNATATGGTAPYTFQWDFGDGNTAVGATSTHTYAAAGNFNAVLTVTDSAGQTDTDTQQVGVTAPMADRDWLGCNESADPLTFGDTGTYTCGAENRGPHDDSATTATFDFVNADVLSAICSSGGCNCTIVDDPAGDDAVCTSGTFAANTMENYIITARAHNVGQITLNGTLTGAASDPDAMDLIVIDTTVDPVPAPDAGINCANPPQVAPRTPTQTQCTVTNTGTTNAMGTVFTFTEPIQLNLVNLFYSGSAIIDVAAGTVTADLAPGQTEFIDVTFEVTDLLGGATYLLDADAFVAGDSDPSNDSATIAVNAAALTSIDVQPNGFSLPVGRTQQLTATANYSNGAFFDATQDATWASSNTALVTVSNAAGAKGLVSGMGLGSADVTATLGVISDAITVDVTSAAIDSIEITPNNFTAPNLAGFNVQYTATATLSDGNTVDISSTCAWATEFVTLATVSNTGLVTLTGTAGQTDISCTQDGVTDFEGLDIEDPVSFDVQPDTLILNFNATAQLTATATLLGGMAFDVTNHVTWMSSNTSIATVSNGFVTAQNVAGSADITATAGALSDTTNTTVAAMSAPNLTVICANFPMVAPFTATQTRCDITNNGNAAANGTLVTFTEGTDFNVLNLVVSAGIADLANGTWTLDLAAGATEVVDITGEVTDVLGDDAGYFLDVEVTIFGDSDLSDNSATVTVVSATLNGITVEPSGVSLPVGRDQQYTATGNYSDGTLLDITTRVTWSTSNGAFASVSNTAPTQGLVHAEGVGSVDIIATVGPLFGSEPVTVIDAAIESIAITPVDATLPALTGVEVPYTATGTFSDGNTLDITRNCTWTTGDAGIFGVDSMGVVTTAGPVGQASIFCEQGGVTGSTMVITENPASFNVAPDTLMLDFNATTPLNAIVIMSNGDLFDVTDDVTWISSDTNVATVDANGLVTAGMINGATSIQATIGAFSDSSTVTVMDTSNTDLSVFGSDFPSTHPFHAEQTQFSVTELAGVHATNGLINFVPLSPGLTIFSVSSDLATIICMQPAGPCTGSIPAFGSVGLTIDAESRNPLGGMPETLRVDATTPGDNVSANDSFTVNMPVAALTSVMVGPDGRTAPVGVTVPVRAIGFFSDGGSEDLTEQATWSTSDMALATVSNASGTRGEVTTLAQGTVNIFAAIGMFSDDTTLTINPAGGASMSLTVAGPGTVVTLLPTAYDVTIDTTGGTFTNQMLEIQASQDMLTQEVIVLSGNAACIMPPFRQANLAVCNFTGEPGLQIRLRHVGLADTPAPQRPQSFTYTLVPGDSNNFDDEVVLPITAVFGSLVVTPNTAELIVGDAPQQFSAMATAPGVAYDVTELVTWASSNSAVAGVDNSTMKGLVTALQPGFTSIRATHNFSFAQASVNVFEIIAARITPGIINEGIAGAPVQAMLHKIRNDGRALPADFADQATWMSSNSAVATVTSAGDPTPGVINFTGLGNAMITATINGLSDDINVNVTSTPQPQRHIVATGQNGIRIFHIDPMTGIPTLVGEDTTNGPADSLDTFADRAIAGRSIAFNNSNLSFFQVSRLGLPLNERVISLQERDLSNSTNRQRVCNAATQPASRSLVIHRIVGDMLAPADTVTFPNAFPVKVHHNPVHDVVYTSDGPNLLIATYDAMTCDYTNTGIVGHYPNRVDYAVARDGNSLYILTSDFATNSSAFLIQPLLNGIPTGPEISTPLAKPAFRLAVHPDKDIAYALHFDDTVTVITINPATNTATIGPNVPMPGIDSLLVPAGLPFLYFSTFFPAPGLCHVAQDAQGVPVGAPVCDFNIGTLIFNMSESPR